jgi:hypothetical protein
MRFVRDPRFQTAPAGMKTQQQPETITVITEQASSTTSSVPGPPTEAAAISLDTVAATTTAIMTAPINIIPPPPTTPAFQATANNIPPPATANTFQETVETNSDDIDDIIEYDETKSEEDIVEVQHMSEDNDHEAVVYDNESYNIHLQRQLTAQVEKQSLVLQNWSVTKVDNKTNKSITWKICENHIPTENVVEYDVIGVRGVHWGRFAVLKNCLKAKCNTKENRSGPDAKRGIEMHITPYFDLLLTLWPGDWKKQLTNLNNQISILMKKKETKKIKTN